MAHIDPVNHLTTQELVDLLRPATEAWFNNLELLAFQELLRRLPDGTTTLDEIVKGGFPDAPR